MGDTWYAGGNPPVRLNRPYRQRGTPPWFRRSDVPFLKFLRQTGRTPDVLADDDLEAFPSGDELRRLYDLVVFPGHSEYVTEHTYDVVQRFRDLGGRLIFLTANNFFWKVEKNGQWMTRIKLWRNLGRPEAALIGAQYRANDNGTKQGVYNIVDTAVRRGSSKGRASSTGALSARWSAVTESRSTRQHRSRHPGRGCWHRSRTSSAPGLTGEMTYYETEQGARVFCAGALDFSGSITFQPVWRMLDNLWRHMTS